MIFRPNLLNKAYDKLEISDYVPRHEYYMKFAWETYARRSLSLNNKSDQFIFFGNSMTNGLCVESLFNGVNMGVSGETIKNAKSQIKLIRNLENKHIILSYGINDIIAKNNNIISDYDTAIKSLPNSATIYLSSVLPVDEKAFRKGQKEEKLNEQILILNKSLKAYCEKNPQIIFLNTRTYLSGPDGELLIKLHEGDGIHLNELGNRLWAKAIKESLEKNNLKLISKVEN